MRLSDLQFDPAGRIVGVGSLGGAFTRSRFLVARLLGDLEPDGTFGVAGFASEPARDDLAPGFGSAATRSDGSVVAAGASGTLGYSRPEIASFSGNGELDTSFGQAGFVAEYPADIGRVAGADALVIDVADRITASIDQRLVRFTPAGAIDRTFGADGVVPFDFLLSELITSADGAVLAVGNRNGGGGVLVRWSADGSPDQSFGDGGTAILATVDGRPAWFVSGALDSRGRLVVLGEITGMPEIELFVARFTMEDPQTRGGASASTTSARRGR